MTKLLKILCPCAYLVFLTPKREYVNGKRCVWFVWGLLLGYAFYDLILLDLDFSEGTSDMLGLSVCALLSTGLAFSDQIRCIVLLSVPIFAGNTGRTALKALVLAYLFGGPVANLASNGREVARTFACTAQLTINLTRTRFDLMFRPFQTALLQMKTNGNEMKDTLRLSGSAEAQPVRERYVAKVRGRCRAQVRATGSRCRKAFASALDACHRATPVIIGWLLCWPARLDFACAILEALGGDRACDPSPVIPADLDKNYNSLKKAQSFLVNSSSAVRLQYSLPEHLPGDELVAAAALAREGAAGAWREVQGRVDFLTTVLALLKRLLALASLRIMVQAQKYMELYLSDVTFDNGHITKYFRRIDARRRQRQVSTLLPLRRAELRELRASPERPKSSAMRLLRAGAEMGAAAALVMLDAAFTASLYVVRSKGAVTYTQTGHHDLAVSVKGQGPIAKVVRSVIGGFNVKKHIKIERSNAECLPNPQVLPRHYLYKIFGIYATILLLIVVQGYLMRLRSLICAYFFRKREKTRTIYLYNEMLKKRTGFMRNMQSKVKELVRERRLQDGMNVCSVLRVRYPKHCDFLRIFPMSRRKCLMCGRVEPYSRARAARDFVECTTPNCYFVHCADCWRDVGRQCWACADIDDD